MIETSNPEIDVHQLMERVRREAGKIVPREERRIVPAPRSQRIALPTIGEVVAPPPLGRSRAVEAKGERLDDLLGKARRMLEVSSAVPRMFHRLFRRQGAFDRSILEVVQALAKMCLQSNKRVNELLIIAEQQNDWLRVLAEQRQTEATWLRTAAPIVANMPRTTDRLAGLDDEVTKLRGEQQTLIESLEARSPDISRQAEHLRNLQVQLDRQVELLQGARADFEKEAEHLRNLQREMDGAGEHLRNLQGDGARHAQELQKLREQSDVGAMERAKLETHFHHLAHLRDAVEHLEERHTNDAIYLKGELSRHSALLHRAGASADRAEVATATPASYDSHELDSFYLSFENRFRGSRSEIKKRVAFYLPLLEEARAGAADWPVLDLGCGRGEWLELLKEQGLDGIGVDLNRPMVAQCVQRGLSVTEGDVIEHLRSLDDQSQGAITGFHIIEHLPLQVLIDMLSETRRVLKSGGLAIFESPNCKNLTVGACNFNVDPTHRNPIFPETAQFMLETHGFEAVHLEYLSPATGSPFAGDTPDSIALANLLYGPQDFAVIGRKPGPQ